MGGWRGGGGPILTGLDGTGTVIGIGEKGQGRGKNSPYVSSTAVLRNMDVVSRITHWHEPPVAVPPEIRVVRVDLPQSVKDEFRLGLPRGGGTTTRTTATTATTRTTTILPPPPRIWRSTASTSPPPYRFIPRDSTCPTPSP